MKELITEIEIQAPAERVWQLLTDFVRFPEWNPFLRRLEGKLTKGGRLKVFMKPSGSFGMTMRPTVIRLDPPHEMRWLGHLFVRGLFDGEHAFVIEEFAPGRVRFIQRETFRGILIPLFARMLDKDTKRGFLEMNQALKLRAERTPD
ncbi:MAG: SRPBCC domain-containing protein [Acidobacteriota bacterium]|nr:SRPBCC domain-containing protein [Acidobacteriota bacterium]